MKEKKTFFSLKQNHLTINNTLKARTGQLLQHIENCPQDIKAGPSQQGAHYCSCISHILSKQQLLQEEVTATTFLVLKTKHKIRIGRVKMAEDQVFSEVWSGCFDPRALNPDLLAHLSIMSGLVMEIQAQPNSPCLGLVS